MSYEGPESIVCDIICGVLPFGIYAYGEGDSVSDDNSDNNSAPVANARPYEKNTL
jgi:hypothetical protein